MVKRFQVLAVTRDKEYDLTKGTKGSKVLYMTANSNGEAEIVTVYLTQGAKARVAPAVRNSVATPPATPSATPSSQGWPRLSRCRRFRTSAIATAQNCTGS